jgi:tRNA dimethylallyltransferase
MAEPHFLAIVGPTASGKTGLSLEVGRQLYGEVISMESRQIYRGMDIGTGKVTLRERALLPHHGLDLRNPDERYSAGRFSRDARGWIRDIRVRGKVPLLVGGTGFFLKSLTEPMFSEPEMDRDRLGRLRTFLNGLSQEDLQVFRRVLEPEAEADGAGADRQRLTRRIEMALLTGRPLSWWHESVQPAEDPLPGVIVLLDLPRELLYDRINRRVEEMIREGLLAEVEGLLNAGFGPQDPGMTGAGYREVVSHLQGEISLEETVEEIQRSHRRYARRQTTWYRHQLASGALMLDGTRPRADLAREVVEGWKKGGGCPGRAIPLSEGNVDRGGP